MAPFLIAFPEAVAADAFDEVDRMRRLRPGLYLALAELTLSELYHAVKRRLPDGTPLLVAPLAGRPKFKGMAAGSTRWTAAHIATG